MNLLDQFSSHSISNMDMNNAVGGQDGGHWEKITCDHGYEHWIYVLPEVVVYP